MANAYLDKVVPVTAFAYDGRVYSTEKEAKAAKQRADLIILLREEFGTCVECESAVDFLIKHKNKVLDTLL